MIIPVRCFSCSKVLANKWKYYSTEMKKLENEKDNRAIKDKIIVLIVIFLQCIEILIIEN